jgi:threonine/homoserine/homoserine lactone efflux protein
MWFYLLQGIGYGFAAASQPGPFQSYLISQTLTRGWKRTLSATLAPLISDGPIILVCLLVLSQVPAWLQRFLYLAGGLFVLYLAYGAFKAWKNFDASIPQTEVGARQNIFKAALMNTLSPGPYIFWTLVFYLTLVGGLAAIVLVFGTAARLGPTVHRTLLGVSAIALFCFGAYQLWQGFV